MQPFCHNRHGPNMRRAAVPLFVPRPACVPSVILIHPTVWPQYTNVRDRQDRTDRQRSGSIGRTVLQKFRDRIDRSKVSVTVVGSAVKMYLLLFIMEWTAQ